jgi:hypothetical protein
MGWTSLSRQKGLTDREFFENEFPTMLGAHGRIVACATMPGSEGRVFYAAVANTSDAPRKPGETWALVVLMHWTPRSCWNFAYKEMSEESGPSEANAPAAVLDALTATGNDYAIEWRAACRANLAARAARPKVKPGDTVVFAVPMTFNSGRTLSELVFVGRNVFAVPGGGGQCQVSKWRERAFTVQPAPPRAAGVCSQCGPGHDRGDGRCGRHGKRIAAAAVR